MLNLTIIDTATVLSFLAFIYYRLSKLSNEISKLDGKVEVILIMMNCDTYDERKKERKKGRKQKDNFKYTTTAA